MSTVISCTLFSSCPAVRLANSCVGRLPSVAPPSAIAPFSSQRRSRSFSVCRATNPKGEHNPKTDLHPFNIPPFVLVHPVPPREERWQLEEEADRVSLWFEVPGQSREDLAVEIDEDVLVIKKRGNTLAAENMDQGNGGGRVRRDTKNIPSPGQQGSPAAKVAATDSDVIYARLLLPAGYSKESVEAELKSGELRVSIAKIKEQARRKINVNIDVK